MTSDLTYTENAVKSHTFLIYQFVERCQIVVIEIFFFHQLQKGQALKRTRNNFS